VVQTHFVIITSMMTGLWSEASVSSRTVQTSLISTESVTKKVSMALLGASPPGKVFLSSRGTSAAEKASIINSWSGAISGASASALKSPPRMTGSPETSRMIEAISSICFCRWSAVRPRWVL